MDPTLPLEQLSALRIGALTIPPALWIAAMVGAVSFLSAGAAIWFLGHRLRRTDILSQPAPTLEPEETCTFLFLNRTLWSATPSAQQALDQFPVESDTWSNIVDGLHSETQDIAALFDDLATNGTAFSQIVTTHENKLTEVQGKPQGRYINVSFKDLDENQVTRHNLEKSLEIHRDRVAFSDTVQNTAPIMMWRRHASGAIRWLNDCAREIVGSDDTETTLPEVFRTDVQSGMNGVRRAPFRDEDEDDADIVWFDVLEVEIGENDIVGYATNINPLVRTEDSLQRFISTLTETFAQLPVGLSIFDEDMTLNLFNPSLIDLLGFDPTRLARRPSLREFFDMLRENRMVPGPKNSDDWRQYIQRIQDEATNGTLRERLVLPSGKTFDLTGSPHPHGAIALIFEDISPMTHLEQQFRAETELSHATLDRLSEAVAVFDTSGALVFANASFADLWGFGVANGEDPIRIVDATRKWIDKSLPTPVWGDLRDFATSSGERCNWDSEVDLKDGRRIYAGFSPLPNGSSLAVFSDITNETRIRASHKIQLAAAAQTTGNDTEQTDLALRRLRKTIQKAAEAMTQTGADNAAALQTNLLDALAQAEDLIGTDDAGSAMRGSKLGELTVYLGQVAEARGLELDVSMDEDMAGTPVDDDLRRLLLNLIIASGDIMVGGSVAQLSIVAVDNGTALSCMGEPKPTARNAKTIQNSLPFRLLERIAERLEGGVSMAEIGAGSTIKISCTVPGQKSKKVTSIKSGAQESA